MRPPSLLPTAALVVASVLFDGAAIAFTTPHVVRPSPSLPSLPPLIATSITVRGGAAAPRKTASALYASTSSAVVDSTDENTIMRTAIGVGAATALMGFIYGKILDFAVTCVWKRAPLALLAPGRGLDGILGGGRYISATCAFGGLLVGLLATKLRQTCVAADFVSSLSSSSSSSNKDLLPGLLPALPNLLLLSLATSAFGFSVGPEAPMVCAGAMVGVAAARRYCSSVGGEGTSASAQEILAYAGAAGALTAFMGIPLAGPIFALELTRASAGMNGAARDALGPAVAASAAALVLIRGVLRPGASVGGGFSYGAVGALSGRTAMLIALTCGAGGAVLGTGFQKVVHAMKDVFWKVNTTAGEKEKEGGFKISRELLVKTSVGIVVGLLSAAYPSTMFWGEGSLQTAIDGQKTAFAATHHGLSSALTASALVDPSVPFRSAFEAAQVGFAKLLSIALACAAKFPGGNIFPLFFAAAPIAHAAVAVLPTLPAAVSPVAVMSLMASTQASVTRTPLATIFILALSASPSTEMSAMLPSVILSSYLGVFISRLLSKTSYFAYSE